MANRLKCRKHAASIREAANRWRDYGVERFRGDKTMGNAYRNDASTLRKIGTLLRNDKLKEAYDKACSLDIVIREEIPPKAWLFMGGTLPFEDVVKVGDMNLKYFSFYCTECSKSGTSIVPLNGSNPSHPVGWSMDYYTGQVTCSQCVARKQRAAKLRAVKL